MKNILQNSHFKGEDSPYENHARDFSLFKSKVGSTSRFKISRKAQSSISHCMFLEGYDRRPLCQAS